MNPRNYIGVNIGFWTDEKILALSHAARLLFIASWHHACDEGHVRLPVVEAKARAFPVDPMTVQDVANLVEEISRQKLWVALGDDRYEIHNYAKHQRRDSRWPRTCDACDSGVAAQAEVARDAERARKRKAVKGAPKGSRRLPDGNPRVPAPDGDGEGEVDADGERRFGHLTDQALIDYFEGFVVIAMTEDEKVTVESMYQQDKDIGYIARTLNRRRKSEPEAARTPRRYEPPPPDPMADLPDWMRA